MPHRRFLLHSYRVLLKKAAAIDQQPTLRSMLTTVDIVGDSVSVQIKGYNPISDQYSTVQLVQRAFRCTLPRLPTEEATSVFFCLNWMSNAEQLRDVMFSVEEAKRNGDEVAGNNNNNKVLLDAAPKKVGPWSLLLTRPCELRDLYHRKALLVAAHSKKETVAFDLCSSVRKKAIQALPQRVLNVLSPAAQQFLQRTPLFGGGPDRVPDLFVVHTNHLVQFHLVTGTPSRRAQPFYVHSIYEILELSDAMLETLGAHNCRIFGGCFRFKSSDAHLPSHYAVAVRDSAHLSSLIASGDVWAQGMMSCGKSALAMLKHSLPARLHDARASRQKVFLDAFSRRISKSGPGSLHQCTVVGGKPISQRVLDKR